MRGAPRKTTPRVKDGRVQRKNHRDEWTVDDGPLEVVTEVPGLGYRHVLDEALLRQFMALVPDWERVSRGLRTVTLCEGDEYREGYYFDGRIELSAWSDPPAQTVGPWHFADHRAVWERLGIGWRDAPEMVAEIARDHKERLEENLWDLFKHYDWEIEETGPDTVVCRDSKAPGKPAICDVVYAGDAVCVYERRMLVRFDRRTAADYMLLHVFLHELGHHVDAMTPPRKGRTTRGEDYAELWALRTADAMWDAWVSRR